MILLLALRIRIRLQNRRDGLCPGALQQLKLLALPVAVCDRVRERYRRDAVHLPFADLNAFVVL